MCEREEGHYGSAAGCVFDSKDPFCAACFTRKEDEGNRLLKEKDPPHLSNSHCKVCEISRNREPKSKVFTKRVASLKLLACSGALKPLETLTQ